MTDPIQSASSPNISYYPDAEGATAAENAAQACLDSEHPAPPVSNPSPPGAAPLVRKFEPSTLAALAECKSEAAGLSLKIAAVALSAPETLGASLLAAGVLVHASNTLTACLDRDLKAQAAKAGR